MSVPGALAPLLEVASQLGYDRMSRSVYDQHRRPYTPSSGQLSADFGGWPAVCKAAGLRPPSGRYPSGTKESVIHALRACAGIGSADTSHKAPVRLRRMDYREWLDDHAGPTLSVVRREFGTWDAATRAAGLAPTRMRRVVDCPELTRQVQATLAELRARGLRLSTRNYDKHRPLGVPQARRVGALHGGWHGALAYYGAS
jgi:hypothetical protein